MLKRRITILAIASIALCVFITLVVMTVHNGIVNEFKGKNHRFAGDCVVSTDSLVGFTYYEDFLAELRAKPFVFAAAPAIKSFGLLNQPGSDINIGIEITGIEPGEFSRATGFGKTLYYNRLQPQDAFAHNYDKNLPGCVVGIIMMQGGTDKSGKYHHSSFRSRYEFSISCFPLTAKGALAKMSTGLVNSKTFIYADDSHTQIPKVDSKMIYIPFHFAQKLCGMDGPDKRVNAIHIKFAENTSVSEGTEKVKALWQSFLQKNDDKKYANLLQNVTVQKWTDFRRSSIAPMEKEQTMLLMLFIMLGFITVFIIFVVFYMIISHKSKDIGILKSIGISAISIVNIFLAFAFLVGAIGSLVGAVCGWAFVSKANDIEAWLFEEYGWQLWDRSVYAIGAIPDQVQINVVTLIVISAVAASLLGALIPSIQAARKTPVEILQVNQL